MKWFTLFTVGILVIAACLAGCVDEDNPPPAPEQQIYTQAGQPLVLYGDVTGNGQLGGELVTGTIDTITMTIGLAPGEDTVDMEKISIVYADAIRTESLIPVEEYYG